jgi:hypothetical protein
VALGCRRYRPIALTFNARSTILEQEIGDDWDSDIQKQWCQAYGAGGFDLSLGRSRGGTELHAHGDRYAMRASG